MPKPKTLNGPMRLSIRVLGEDGKPVKGVAAVTTLAIRKGGQVTTTRKETSVDGLYRFEHPGCASIGVELTRAGYHGVKQGFSYAQPRPDARGEGRMQIYDLTVTMRKTGGAPGDVAEVTGTITWTAARPGGGLDLSPLGREGNWGTARYLPDAAPGPAQATQPRLRVELKPSRAPRPAIYFGKTREVLRPADTDVALVLEDTAEGSGLFAVDGKEAIARVLASTEARTVAAAQIAAAREGARGPGLSEETILIRGLRGPIQREVFIGMTEAPAEGYQSRLAIPDDAWERQYPVAFYFKVNGYYGKGCVRGLRYEGGAKRLTVSVLLKVARDGTRNVTRVE